MKRTFRPTEFFTAADGTEVSAFLNATDTTQTDVPWGLLGGVSIAAGRIRPGVDSSIHVHAAAVQVTFVVAGELTVRMKARHDSEPYTLRVPAGDAVVCEPGTLIQLSNKTAAEVEVLYIVSPSYVFERDADGLVIHDDSVLVADWSEHVTSKDRRTARERRAASLGRLAAFRRSR